jgi:hypothetical protein
LIQHLDPVRSRVAHAGELDGRTVDKNLTVIRLQRPGKNLGESRLPGTVVSDESNDLAWSYVEIDALERLDGAKALGAAPQLHAARGTGR